MKNMRFGDLRRRSINRIDSGVYYGDYLNGAMYLMNNYKFADIWYIIYI